MAEFGDVTIAILPITITNSINGVGIGLDIDGMDVGIGIDGIGVGISIDIDHVVIVLFRLQLKSALKKI